MDPKNLPQYIDRKKLIGYNMVNKIIVFAIYFINIFHFA